MQTNHLGFTLIELLVVVLIIGILASVALPQYQKAVEKSRAAEAIQNLKVLRDQQALCILVNGDSGSCMQGSDDDNLFTNIDIEIKSTEKPLFDTGWKPTSGPVTKNFEYYADGQYVGAIRRPDGKYQLETTSYQSNYEDIEVNNIVCFNNSDEKDWCKMFGGEGVPIH